MHKGIFVFSIGGLISISLGLVSALFMVAYLNTEMQDSFAYSFLLLIGSILVFIVTMIIGLPLLLKET
jgi:hypothetical protein